MFGKIGPGANAICRRPVAGSSWMMSVPVMSDGIRSGVNWIRENLRSSTCAMVWMSSVLARPGTPVMGEAGPAVIDAVAPHEQREQHLLVHLLLPHDQLAQLGREALPARLEP